MSTPEKFRKQLQQSLSRIEQERLARSKKKEILKQKEEEGIWNREQQRNQAVLKAESEIPARQYLEELRLLMNPSEEMMRFGPLNGAVAYAFLYDKQIVFSERYRRQSGPHPALFRENRLNEYPKDPTEDHYKAIGVILTHTKRIAITYPYAIKQHEKPYHDDDFNPLPVFVDESYFWRNLETFKGDSRRDIKRFTQKLADFYINHNMRATK